MNRSVAAACIATAYATLAYVLWSRYYRPVLAVVVAAFGCLCVALALWSPPIDDDDDDEDGWMNRSH